MSGLFLVAATICVIAAVSAGAAAFALTIWAYIRRAGCFPTWSRRKVQRAEREELMAMLQAERERSPELTARVMKLSEIAITRSNGGDANSDAKK